MKLKDIYNEIKIVAPKGAINIINTFRITKDEFLKDTVEYASVWYCKIQIAGYPFPSPSFNVKEQVGTNWSFSSLSNDYGDYILEKGFPIGLDEGHAAICNETKSALDKIKINYHTFNYESENHPEDYIEHIQIKTKLNPNRISFDNKII